MPQPEPLPEPMRNYRPQYALATWLFGAVLICLTLLAPAVQAACPEPAVVGTSIPVVYQDCIEIKDIDIDAGQAFDSILNTSANTQTGDYQVLVIVTSGDPTFSLPAGGWTTIQAGWQDDSGGGPDVTIGVFAKFATAAGSEAITINTAAGGNNKDGLAWVQRFSNTDGRDAAAYAESRSPGSVDVISPAITTTLVNSLVLRLAGIDDDDFLTQPGYSLDSNAFGAPNIGITLDSVDGGATGIASYRIQPAVGSSGTATATAINAGVEEQVMISMALLPRPYFSLTVPPAGETCSLHTISIAARNIDGSINTGYTGTIALSTSTGLGNWTTAGGDANNTLVGGAANNGTASYTFVGADQGSIDLVYTNSATGSVNFNIVDGSNNRELKTQANDSNLAITTCTASNFLLLAQSGTAGVCGAVEVTLSATTGLIPNATYTGTVQLSIAAGQGNWTVAPGAFGSLNNGTVDDGIASYTFADQDDGVVVLYFYPNSVGAVTLDADDLADPFRTVHPSSNTSLAIENCEYRISHDLNGNTCSKESITFSVVTSSGAVVRNFGGTLALNVTSAATDKGTWNLPVGATGTLTDTTIKDGIASYTFAASNNGVITLGFATTLTGTFNFNVTGSSLGTNVGFDPTLTVAACKFRVVYTGGNATDVCSYKEVTISVVDDNNVAVTDFTGQVNLTTTSGKGSWQKSGVQPGTLTDLLDNDGSASYTFVAADAGNVALLLNVPEAGAGTLKIGVSTPGGGTQVDPAFNPDLTIALCSIRIVVVDGFMTTCNNESVTLSVYNSSNVLATNYGGTVNLSTLTGNGTWLNVNGAGAFSDPVADDGDASYTFVPGSPTVNLLFYDEVAELQNLNAIDSKESNFREASGFDPNLEVNSCLPLVFATQCYQGDTQANAISIPAEVVGLESRMVLLYIMTESSTAASNARLSIGATNYPLTRIEFAAAANVRMEVWGILGDTLPATAATFNVAFDGAPWGSIPGMCLVSLEGAKQILPVKTVPPENGPVNSFVSDANVNNNALTLTSSENNSLAISAYGSGGNNVADMTSSLTNILWDLNRTNPVAPDGSNFNANSGYISAASQFTLNIDTAGQAPRFAHIALALAPVVAGHPFADNYEPVILLETISGNVSYRAVGKSLRANANPLTAPFTAACVMNPSSAATVDLPPGSAIRKAYLYWAGSGATANIDNTVTFGPTAGSQVAITADDIFQIEGVGGGLNLDYFAGYKDVTPLITTNTSESYTLSNLTVQTGTPWLDTSACLGGWGMVVVFENAVYEPQLNVVNLFHGFQPFQNSSVSLTPRNFRMPQPDTIENVPRGLMTHLTFEGDNTLNTGNELFEIQNDPNALTFEALTNPYNLGTAQYNDTVTYPDYYSLTTPKPYIAQSTTSYGVDVDTYYLGGKLATAADPKEDVLYPFGLAESEEITTRFSAGQDLVLLVGEFIAISNTDIADLEVLISNGGTFKVNSTGTGSVFLDVINNGNGAASIGYATGTVILTGTMPAGLTINTLVADPHWSCTNTTTAYTCTFDIETWTGGVYDMANAIYQLGEGAYLPQVEIKLNIGDETFFPLASNTAYVSARIAHFASPLSCDFTGILTGQQPDPATCTKAHEYDNVNDLGSNQIDIDDLHEKQPGVNNNVEQGTLTISGVITNLKMDVAVAGVLQQGQPGQYLLTVTNLGPDATTKVMTVTTVFDATAYPAAGAFAVTGWNCTVVGVTLTCTSTATLASGGSSTIAVTIPVVTQVEGQYVSASAAVSPGSFNFDVDVSNNAKTLSSQVVGLIVPLADKFLLSVNEAATLGVNVLGFNPGDLVLFDPAINEAELYFDSAAVGGVTDVDAVHLMPNGWMVFSASGSGTFLTVPYEDEDLILYDPILGTAELLFDGSAADKFDAAAAAADIDAVHVEFNDSWTTSDWDIYISTEDAASLPGVGAFEDKDVVLYDLSAGTASMFFDGSDANKFNGGVGDIAAFFIRYDFPDTFVLAVSDALSTIDTDESFERDDLVEYNDLALDGMKATQVFDGEQSGGFTPLPLSPTLGIDALHVVQEGYYGHFSISVVNGDTCNAGSVTIRKHKGLTHTVETNYRGSIRITDTSGLGAWAIDVSANGVFTDLGGGVARYTFHPDDNGEVVLTLGHAVAANNINIDVTNGIAREALAEDNNIDIGATLLPVDYLDQFNAVSYTGNNGSSGWSSAWNEVNDNLSASTGDIYVTGGKLRMKDSNQDLPYIYRAIDFDYDANTGLDPLTLSFKWSRSGGSSSDVFVVEYSQNLGVSWSAPVGTYGNATSGAITENTATINLTAAGVAATDGQSVWLRFRITSGYLLDNLTLDDVEVSTSSDSDCNPGLLVDHYHIGNSGTLVSCLATNVTFTAHDALHQPVEAGASVLLTIQTSSNKGSWGSPPANLGAFNSSPVSNNGVATYSFLAGETSVTLPFNYTSLTADTETVGFNVSDTNTVLELEEGDIVVSRAGLRFFNETAASTTWPTMVAGMNSLAYTGQTLVVQAVKTSDNDPRACEPLFAAPTVVPVQLVFECQNPTSCGAAATTVAVTNNATTTQVNTVNDNGGAGLSVGGTAEYSTVNLAFSNFTDATFGAYSAGAIQLNYPDVGQLQLHGRYNIRLNNSLAGVASGNFASGSGDAFVVRPFGLEVDFGNDRRSATNASLATDHTSPAFAKAGVAINTSVRAVLWNVADDAVINATGNAGSDGIPDFEANLSDNVVALNFGKEINFAANYGVALSVVTAHPVTAAANPGVPGGIAGSLAQSGTFSSYVGGESSGSNTVAFNEVGIFDVRAVLTDNAATPRTYLGTQAVEGGVRNVGRITPDHYDIDLGASYINERPDYSTPAVTDFTAATFTYMGEAFEANVALQAKHANGTTVLQNYFGDYSKLTDLALVNAGSNAGQLVFKALADTALAADTDYSARISPVAGSFGFDAVWAAGEALLKGRLIFARSAPNGAEDGPLANLTLAVDVLDSDNVGDQGDVGIDNGSNENTGLLWHRLDSMNNEFRYGRLVLQNAYGSELPELDGDNVGRDVGMRVAVEYWDGTEFVVNEDDSATSLDINNIDAMSIVEGPLTIGDIVLTTSVTGGMSTLVDGQTLETGTTDHPFYFTAPGEGKEGSAILEFDLAAAGIDFLGYRWRDAANDEDAFAGAADTDYTDNPRALLEFGVFQGNRRIINWQELFINEIP